jgi:hypothetical protein
VNAMAFLLMVNWNSLRLFWLAFIGGSFRRDS